MENSERHPFVLIFTLSLFFFVPVVFGNIAFPSDDPLPVRSPKVANALDPQYYPEAEINSLVQHSAEATVLGVAVPIKSILAARSQSINTPSQAQCGDVCTSNDTCFDINPDNPYLYYCWEGTCQREDCIGQSCTCIPPISQGDVDSDFDVDRLDLSVVIEKYGFAEGNCNTIGNGLAGDLNGDCVVNLTDINIVIRFYQDS